MPAPPLPHSKSQVNKAGRTLRKAMTGDEAALAAFRQAVSVLEDFRGWHQLSLTTANMGLRSMVASEGCRRQVSQRLKRRETIIDKLVREPTTQLAVEGLGGRLDHRRTGRSTVTATSKPTTPSATRSARPRS